MTSRIYLKDGVRQKGTTTEQHAGKNIGGLKRKETGLQPRYERIRAASSGRKEDSYEV